MEEDEEEERGNGEAARTHIPVSVGWPKETHLRPSWEGTPSNFLKTAITRSNQQANTSRKCVRSPRAELMSLLGLIVEKPQKTADFPGFFVYCALVLTSEAGGEKHEEAEERRVEPEVESHFLASCCFFFRAKSRSRLYYTAGKKEGATPSVCR